MSKYQRWYDQLMDRARGRKIPVNYTEVHHIVPRSLGGTDHEVNLVRLTYREHFIAHWLLTKLHSGLSLRKMHFALLAMTMPASGQRIVSSWQFDVVKRAFARSRPMEFSGNLVESRWKFFEQTAIGGEKKRLELDRLARELLGKAPKPARKIYRKRH